MKFGGLIPQQNLEWERSLEPELQNYQIIEMHFYKIETWSPNMWLSTSNRHTANISNNHHWQGYLHMILKSKEKYFPISGRQTKGNKMSPTHINDNIIREKPKGP